MAELAQFFLTELKEEHRNQIIELINLFFKQVNSYKLDGKFHVKPRAATKMTDMFLKLQGSGKVLVCGTIAKDGELTSLLLGRVEEKPYLEEEKVFYIELAITKTGHRNKGLMKHLLDYSYQWSKKKKISIIELRALIENKEAIQFWRKNGFSDFYIRFRRSI
jgi:GNAT superfamily N-acetyltransferase